VPEAHRATFDDYDRCIREVDHYVGELLQTLDELGLADRTLVVLTSDHGEAFGEHVVIGHGFSYHQEAVHVPLVFRGPGVVGGRRIPTPVSLVDVMPTILDLLGLPAPADIQGRSLRDALAGREVARRPVFFQWIGADHVGMRSGPAKLVRVGSTFQTYDLSKDPDEGAGTPGAPNFGVTDIQQYLDDGARRRQALVDTPRALTISPELHDALRGLGYVE